MQRVCYRTLSWTAAVGVHYLSPTLLVAALALLLKRHGEIDLGVCAVIKHVLESVGVPLARLTSDNAPSLLDVWLKNAVTELFEGASRTCQCGIPMSSL